MMAGSCIIQVMIDHEQKKLRLIDWGLAEFYHPGKECAALMIIFDTHNGMHLQRAPGAVGPCLCTLAAHEQRRCL